MKYRKLHHWKYELMEADHVFIADFIPDCDTEYISIANNRLKCKERYAWDGASFIAFDTRTIMRASLFHDALYNLIKMGKLDKYYRKYADELFRTICLQDGMLSFRAWYCYQAVRIGGGLSINKKDTQRMK